MVRDWKEFINNFADTTGGFARDELIKLIEDTKNDANEFIREQGERLERYMNQLARGEIRKQQFEGYMIDMRDLAELKVMQFSVESKASAQRLANGITKIILDGVLKLI